LKRVIQRELESAMAHKIIAGEIPEGATVRADARNGELVLQAVALTPAEAH
jgi:ATP-dependent Clp protease ATP-binding subunit ClpA